MYKHQIKSLVLAAVIGLGFGVDIQASDDKYFEDIQIPDLEKYTDEELKNMGYSPDIRLYMAVKRSDASMIVDNLKNEKIESRSCWSWWLFGQK